MIIENIDVEQALLGAILADNRALKHVPSSLKPEFFSQPVHERIYAAILKLQGEGHLADPKTLKVLFDRDDALAEIGGAKYLARLAASSVTIINITDFSEIIIDLAMRRQMVEVLQEASVQINSSNDTAVMHASALIGKINDITALQADSGFATDADISDVIIEKMKKQVQPFSTGIPKLDECMGGGLFPGFSYGIAARKKVGKTIISATISHNLNKRANRHLFICGEMSPEEVQQRVLCRELNAYPSEFRRKDNWNLLKRIPAVKEASHKACIYRKAPGITFNELRRVMASAVDRLNITGFILDYWQLVGGKERGKSTAEHLDEVAQWIADFCRRNDLWSLVMAQINQEGNTRGGEGLRLAFDQVYQLHRGEGDFSNDAWLEMMETRYTGWMNIGSDNEAGLILREKGLFFEQV